MAMICVYIRLPLCFRKREGSIFSVDEMLSPHSKVPLTLSEKTVKLPTCHPGPVRLLLTLLVLEPLPVVPSLTQRRVQLAPSVNWSRISKKSQVSDVSWFGKSSISSPMPFSFWTALLSPRPPPPASSLPVRAWVRSISRLWNAPWMVEACSRTTLSSLTLRGLTMLLLLVELSLTIFYCGDQTAWDLGWGAGFGFPHSSPI